jgi:hypothetical protein
MAFTYKAAGLGFGVAKPYGDSESYDFILDSGVRLWRVQVKSTYGKQAHSYGIRACGNNRTSNKAYTAKQIDILVVFLVSENAWYSSPSRLLLHGSTYGSIPPEARPVGATNCTARRGT